MLKSDFYFDLPPELIAQQPSATRGMDRLLVLDRDTGRVTHSGMDALPGFIAPGTVMVFNDSRVRRARVPADCFPPRKTPFRAELLFVSPAGAAAPAGSVPAGPEAALAAGAAAPAGPEAAAGARWRVMLRKAKKITAGTRFVFAGGKEAVAVENAALAGGEFREIVFDSPVDEDWFEKNGRVPLPPYIKRRDTAVDSERYQTVYARETGSAASPTAGLHFTRELLSRLGERGVQAEWLTLHVGPGTFLPVRTERVQDHAMHEERYTIPADTAARLNAARRSGRRLLAVGTTSARALEAAWSEDGIRSGAGATKLFIYPGYAFRAVDALFTNFHTPESTLLMLVCAFAGREKLLAAYREAIERRYRFFSYGDAMFIK